MNYRDFAMARKKKQTAESHKAINRKKAERPLARPRADKNITSSDSRMQGI